MYSLTLLKPHAEALLFWLNEQWVAGKSHINKEYFNIRESELTTTLMLKYSKTNLDIEEHSSFTNLRIRVVTEDYPFDRLDEESVMQQYFTSNYKLHVNTKDKTNLIDWEKQLERFYTYQLLKLIE